MMQPRPAVGPLQIYSNRRLTIKSKGSEEKSPRRMGGGITGGERDSRNGAVILIGIDNDFAKVLNESIDVFAEEDEVEDECKRTAEAFAVLKVCVRREGALANGFHWGTSRFR